jgi:hypothetical protein
MKKTLRTLVATMTLFSASIISIESAQAGLYAFTTHTFTPCGASGTSGPSTANCTSAYSSAIWASNSAYFSTSSGIQVWTVPTTGTYRVTALGARGGVGGSTPFAGGSGAKVQADITLTQGDQIKILVGQIGGTSLNTTSGGGGGGTFVTSSANSPLVIAGGGGGAAGERSTGEKTGAGGANINNGTASRDGLVAGGTGGSGGASPTEAWSGASGGGFTGDGGNGIANSFVATNSGGKSFLNGGAGGIRIGTNNHGAVGGFGGGGGSTWGPGGGGGYSGGGGDSSTGSGTDREGAGGGGSYASGTNSSLTASFNAGDGSVTIQILVGPPDAPTIGTATMLSPTSASITFTAPSNNNGDTITAYTAISTPESRTATITQSGSGTITVTGLSPDTSYVFRVYATNSYGNSANSGPSSSITTTRSPTTITISLPGNASTASYRSATTITATIVGTDGKVTFFINSKRIAKCTNKSTSSLVATCSWLPSIHGGANISANFTPTSSAYLASSTSKPVSISARTNRR